MRLNISKNKNITEFYIPVSRPVTDHGKRMQGGKVGRKNLPLGQAEPKYTQNWKKKKENLWTEHKCNELKSQNHVGWKSLLRSLSATINLELPSSPLNHDPKGQIFSKLSLAFLTDWKTQKLAVSRIEKVI